MRKVVVAEDDDDILFVVTYMLERNGYVVSPVVVGELVIEEVLMMQPDLILMDINLRTCDGRELCLKLKTKYQLQTPIILFSANVYLASTVHLYKADGFIPKPFDLEELLSTVDKCLSASPLV
jgi:DNA-binding response OmpR family regulator